MSGFKCMDCGKTFYYEPIYISSSPDSVVSCFDCLPIDMKKKYLKFEKTLKEKGGSDES